MAKDYFAELAPSGSDYFSGIEAEPVEEPSLLSSVGGFVADTGVDLAKGAVNLGRSVVGLGSMATGGMLGEGMRALGYDPDTTTDFLDSLYSDARAIENANVDQADGFTGTLGALVKNPRSLIGKVAETTPLMLGNIAAARVFAARAGAAAMEAATARGLSAEAAYKVSQKAATRAAILSASAVEGAQQAGMSFDELAQQGVDIGRNYVASLGSGATTAAIAAGGGKLGTKIGLGDVEAGIAGKGGVLARGAKGGAQEGLLEEGPQSATEQVWQNFALERPLGEGVEEATATGLAIGSVAGAGVSALQGRDARPESDAARQKMERLRREEAAHREAVQRGEQFIQGETDGLLPPSPTVGDRVVTYPSQFQVVEGLIPQPEPTPLFPDAGRQTFRNWSEEDARALEGGIPTQRIAVETADEMAGETERGPKASEQDQPWQGVSRGRLPRNPANVGMEAWDGVTQVPGRDETPAPTVRDAVSRRPTMGERLVDQAANEAATSQQNDTPEPSDAQIKAGNYKKGHLNLHGLDISIENPRGSTRESKDPENPWKRRLTAHYGYVRRTEGNDGDQVDVFLGKDPENPDLPIFVIDQVDKNGRFDEHKVWIGAQTEDEARKGYLSNYPKGWQGIGAITPMSAEQFREWLKTGDQKIPADPGMVEKEIGEEIPRLTNDDVPVLTNEDVPVLTERKEDPTDRQEDQIVQLDEFQPQDLGPEPTYEELYGVDEGTEQGMAETAEEPEEAGSYQPFEQPEGWGNALELARSEWEDADRGQRSVIAEKAGYGVARFGPRRRSAATMSWDELPPNVKRAFALWHLPTDTSPARPEPAPTPEDTPEASSAKPETETDGETDVIATKSGKPFKSEAVAKRVRTARGLNDTHDVVPQDGGFVLKPRGEDKKVGVNAKGQEIFETPQNTRYIVEDGIRSESVRLNDQAGFGPDHTPAPKPAAPKKIGVNSKGQDIFEDENGVRSIVESGIRITESVEMRPTRNGYKAVPPTEREARFTPVEDTAPAVEKPAKAQESKKPSVKYEIDDLVRSDDPFYKGKTWRVSFVYNSKDGQTIVLDDPETGERPFGNMSFTTSEFEKVERESVSGPEAPGLGVYDVGDKAYFQGDEVTITSEPYKYLGGEYQEAKTAEGTTVALQTPRYKGERPKADTKLGAKVTPQVGMSDTTGWKKKGDGDAVPGDVVYWNDRLAAEILDVTQSDDGTVNVTYRFAHEKNATGNFFPREKPGNRKTTTAGDFTRLTGVYVANPQSETRAETAPPKPKPTVSENKVFTEDAAEEARRILREKLGNLNAGVDPEVMKAGIVLAGYHIEKGARTFAAYARAMVADMGEGVRPYLKQWYMAVKYDPRAADVEGALESMSSEDEINRLNLDDILASNTGEDQENAELRDDLQRGDEGAGAGVVPEPDSEPSSRVSSRSGRRGSNAAGRRGNNRRDTETERRGRDGEDSTPESSAGERAGDRNRADDRVSREPARNYRISAEDEIGKGGAKTKARQNLEAVRILKTLESEGRQATPEEQAKLAKFVGWGMSEIRNGMFPTGEPKPGWADMAAELKSLLTEEEYAEASRSTQYAHYTSEAVVNSIYAGLSKMGFEGGMILEPGMGSGNFIGLMPDETAANSHYTGIEFDSITAGIAAHLYPESNIKNEDFTKTKLPENFYDLAIGNPPFADITIQSDPKYRARRFKLHDYFFAKSIDSVRPGGLLVFITSRYTMDKQNDVARSYLADRADLLGAIRLPQTAFQANAGTEVVTDVIFLKKREEGAEAAGDAFLELKPVQTPEGEVYINEYFADNPGMVLGTNSMQGSMYGANEYTVLPPKGDIESAFAKATEKLPADVYRAGVSIEEMQAGLEKLDFSPKNRKENGFYLAEDGRLMQTVDGIGKAVNQKSKADMTGLSKRDIAIIKELIPLRDAFRSVLDAQLNDRDYATPQKELTRLYDAFVKKHGLVNHTEIKTRRNPKTGKNIVTRKMKNFPRSFWNDPESMLVAALEDYNELENTARKTAIFDQRVIAPDVEPDIKNAIDALPVVLNQSGRVDMEAIAEKANTTEEEAIEQLGELIYQNPVSGEWETRDEYLSGRVRIKLREAQTAAEENRAYQRNVAALEEVQPADLGPSDITARLGAPWIPTDVIAEFAESEMGYAANVTFEPRTFFWKAQPKKSTNPTLLEQFSTEAMKAPALVDHALNQKQPKVMKTVSDNKGGTTQVTDPEATEAAQAKLNQIKEKFESWIWQDAQRAGRLVGIYNQQYNDTVPRVYDGAHLTLPGMSKVISLRPHQKRVVWRIIQNGNTYMAHTVGAGKTMASVAAAMEQKRLGLIKKPMFVVPNHMLQQFSREFIELYPAAKILVADEQNFHGKTRQRFLARVASENWDGIVITHSAFAFLKVSEEFADRVIQEEIEAYQEALDEIVIDQGDAATKRDPSRRRLEKQIQQLEQKLSGAAGTRKDEGYTFETLGIDQLIVDEAHYFRKIAFATQQGNVKGIDPSGSQRSWDLYIKSKYLRESNPGRGLVLMSGTPVTNTMGEMFNLQRYLDESGLQERGIHRFDGWSSMFGDTVAGLEQTPSGNYQQVTRFAKFVNLPELVKMFRDFTDIVLPVELSGYVKRPTLKTGKMQIISTPRTETLIAYQKRLEERIKNIQAHRGPPKKGDDVILKVIGDGRHAAIDPRFVVPNAQSDPNSKLNKLIDNVYQVWERTKDWEYQDRDGNTERDKGATQMVFSDLGVGDSRGFSAYQWMKESLIRKGVPAEQIAFIQDYKKSEDKLRLFRDMNAGRKRILIGSTPAMGTGVNAQQRLYALHHLDASWFPADIEQRRGRIMRQGNKNAEVEEFAYVTEGTYDATMWQMNETKQRFIDQVMSGDTSIRTMEDIGTPANEFAVAKAIASGDERVMKLAGLKGDVQRLDRLRRAHIDEQYNLGGRIAREESQAKHYERAIKDAADDLKRRQETAGEAFKATVAGKAYTERKDAGEAIIKETMALYYGAEAEAVDTDIGKIGGFNITAKVPRRSTDRKGKIGERTTYPDVSIGMASPTNVIQIREGDTKPLGLVASLENKLRSIESNVEKWEADLQRTQSQLDGLRAKKGQAFDKEAEYQAKLAEMKQIEEDLAADSAEEVNVEGSSPDEAAFARGPQRAGRLTPEEVRADLEKRFGKRAISRLIESGRFKILANQDEAMKELNRLAPGKFTQASGLGNIYGFFDQKDTSYLVAGNLDKTGAPYSDPVRVFLHELGVHHGLRRVFGEETYRDVLKAVKRLESAGRRRQALRDEGRNVERGMDADVVYSAIQRIPDPETLTKEQLDDEQIAYVVNFAPDTSIGRRIIARIKAFLLRMGVPARFLPELTVADFVAIAEGAAKHLAEGPVVNSDPTFARAPATDTEAFKKWFGDSKVVDENGEPLVVYHGTDADFTVFDTGDAGSHFGTERQALSRAPDAAPYYLSIENPKRVKDPGADWLTVVKKAKAEGHDGIVYLNRGEGIANEDGSVDEDAIANARTDAQFLTAVPHARDSWIAFRPEQIKSATGNLGTFDPTNPDIRFARGTEETPDFDTVIENRSRLKELGLARDAANTRREIARLQRQIDNIDPMMPGQDRAKEIKNREKLINARKRSFMRRYEEALESQTESDFHDLNLRVREEHRTLWDRAKKMLRRQFAPGGLLPSEIFPEKVTRDSQFNAVEFDVRHYVGQLEHAIKKEYGKPFRQVDDGERLLISNALEGDNEALTTLPDKTATVVMAMRQYIDALSTQYVDILQAQVDALDPESPAAAAKISLMETIIGNIGKYAHRSYQAFDDPKWFARISDKVLDDARVFLRAQYTAQGSEDPNADAERTLNEIIKTGTAYESMEGFIMESKLGQKDLSVLKRRKDIAPEIRALLGEYVDPRVRFAKSSTKMGRLIWNQKFLDSVLEKGKGVFLWEQGERPPDATAQIAGITDKTYDPLNGLWTTPEVKQAFIDALNKQQMEDWYRTVVQLNGLVKFGKTVLSPTTAARNWQSAMFFAVANGHFDMRHMRRSVEGLREYFTQGGKREKLDYLRELLELGVIYDTPYAGEMMRLLDDSQIMETMLAGKSRATFGEAMRYATKFYQYGDDFWKIIGFENEKRLLMKHAGMDEAAAKQEAARRIRDTYPTYSMVGRAIQSLRRFPLAGTFVSFPAEIIRTTANMARYVAKDLKNPGMRPLALRRLAGMSVAAAFAYALQEWTKALLGVDDEEEEAVRTLAAPWNRNSNFLFLDRDENGDLEYIDLSFLDPYNIWKRPVTAIMRDQPWDDKLVSAVGDMVSPFLGTDIAAGAIFEILANKRLDTGTQVYVEHDLPHQQTVAIANHLRKALQPGLASNMERTYRAMKGEVRASGRQYELDDELVAWAGWRKTTLDPKVALYYRSFEFKDSKSDATRTLTRVLRDPNETSKRSIENAYRNALDLRQIAYTDMARVIHAARKSGMTEREIAKILRASRISKDDVRHLLEGRVPSWSLSTSSMRGAIQRAETLIGPDVAERIRERYEAVRQGSIQ